ncbi:hypothetical protein DPMN_066523 [Dreissena polymorpha]|uniref:Uncharacterized protein n=1 Tax=Dreissena polymorpha TaxID=45954 RepID=A0A9D3YXI9_DREPO|nr:hypothetical protein DPMN_066523 [Dreissena polymorpha]
MQGTLKDHHISISIGGRPINNLKIADDIDIVVGTSKNIDGFTNRLYEGAES